MTILRILFALVAVPYVGYGLRRFGLGFWTSPRFVRNQPRTGLWGPIRFFSRETWTDEGLREREWLFVWQAGCLVLAAVGLILFV